MKLRKPCQHGRYDEHLIWDDEGTMEEDCPGGEFATLDNLIAAINGLGVEGTVTVRYIGPEQPPVYIDIKKFPAWSEHTTKPPASP